MSNKATLKHELFTAVSFVKTLQVEGLVLAALMVVLTYKAEQSLWFLLYTFLLFDISMIGYAINKTVGAAFYNVGHSTILPTVLLIIGLLADNHATQIWSYAWLFHISIDRSLGYGLKHKKSFQHTHLGRIGH